MGKLASKSQRLFTSCLVMLSMVSCQRSSPLVQGCHYFETIDKSSEAPIEVELVTPNWSAKQIFRETFNREIYDEQIRLINAEDKPFGLIVESRIANTSKRVVGDNPDVAFPVRIESGTPFTMPLLIYNGFHKRGNEFAGFTTFRLLLFVNFVQIPIAWPGKQHTQPYIQLTNFEPFTEMGLVLHFPGFTQSTHHISIVTIGVASSPSDTLKPFYSGLQVSTQTERRMEVWSGMDGPSPNLQRYLTAKETFDEDIMFTRIEWATEKPFNSTTPISKEQLLRINSETSFCQSTVFMGRGPDVPSTLVHLLIDDVSVGKTSIPHMKSGIDTLQKFQMPKTISPGEHTITLIAFKNVSSTLATEDRLIGSYSIASTLRTPIRVE